MVGTYSPVLVVLSIVVASLASYTALDLVQRITRQHAGAYRRFWLAGGSLAMGIGIWSMHFIGMLAYSLPIDVGYDVWITLLSLAIAVVVSSFALQSVTKGTLSNRRVVVGGSLMGVGIAAMHYTGMEAMRMAPHMTYVPWIFAASIAVAVVVAMVALKIAFSLSADEVGRPVLRKLVAAVVMGCAIAGMHYTGMAAVRFAPDSISLAGHVDNTWLTITISGMTFSVLTIALILSVLDARLESRTSKLATSLKTANDKLMHLATHDPLTDLPNRLLLTDRIEHALHAARRSDRSCAVLYLDLDGFKPINDSLGHPIGDALLKAVASRLSGIVRREDTLARVGGDEFVILMEALNHSDDAMAMCERVLGAMREPIHAGPTPLHVTMSMGIALFPHDGDTVETLLQNADAAMYEVKRGGRNGYRYFEHAMNANALRSLRIQADLREALDKGQLSLHFQPKFGCIDKTLIGCEALIRWHHPELGWIPPAEFIPIAERSGLILEVGDWVVEEACRHIVAWRRRGLPPVKVAVNLSPKQLGQRDMPRRIAGIVARHGLDPSLLMLEITETAAMDDADLTVALIHELQHIGFDVAIDDFGTGYSSLSYLEKFKVRQLKVDRHFIDSLDKAGTQGPAIVAAIIALAHSLHMEVVAEGVETNSQMSTLGRLLCDQLQGYLLGRPMPADAFARVLEGEEGAAAAASRIPEETGADT